MPKHDFREPQMDDARKSNSCSGFSDFEFQELTSIAETYIATSGLLMTLVELAGRLPQSVLNQLPADWSLKLNQLGEQALTAAYEMAVLSSGPVERGAWLEAVLSRASSERFHKLAAAVMGALGGIAGLPGTLVELPVTTTLMLRSIQEIAKSYGEDPEKDAIRQQCLQVLAYGGPLIEDDDLEKGFFEARLTINASTIPLLIRTVAARFNVVVAEKFLASAVPVLAVGAGAVVNYTFISYFQNMAHVHFRLRRIENANDPDQVKSCFQRIVMALRQQRRGGK
jgi:EcsC protein family